MNVDDGDGQDPTREGSEKDVVPTEVVVVKTEAPDSFEEDESDSEIIDPDIMVPMMEIDEVGDEKQNLAKSVRGSTAQDNDVGTNGEDEAIKRYSCDRCDYKSDDVTDIVLHERDEHGCAPSLDKPFACSYCDYSTLYPSNLSEHMQTHSKVRNKCHLCAEQFTTAAELAAHKQTTHPADTGGVVDDARPYRCAFCSYRTSVKGSLRSHVRVHTGERPYACTQCAYKARTSSGLASHRSTVHSVNRPYACSLCDGAYRTAYPNSLVAHVRAHRGERPHACPECPYRGVTTAQLSTHYKATHSEDASRYHCSQCDYTTRLKSTLTAHARTHAGPDDEKPKGGREKKYACDECSFRTTHKGALNTHKATHKVAKQEEPERHRCDLCDYTTPFTDDLILHKDTVHKGARRRRKQQPPPKDTVYECNMCDYKSPHKSKVTLHRMTHTGEKPYACDLCPYRSSQAGHLTQHRMTHTGQKPFACTECDYRTTYSSNLAQHRMRHKGVRPFQCDICDYSATCSSNLTRHVRMHNTDLAQEEEEPN